MKNLIFLIALYSLSLQSAEKPTILFVGDSHSFGRMGTTIENRLRSVSDDVIMESSCGATSSTWLGRSGYKKTICGFWKKDNNEEIRSKEHQTPKFIDELAQYRPQITIVQLGTNMATASKPAIFTKSINEMMEAIKRENSECIWIGPPDANSKIVTKAKLRETNNLLINLSKKNNCYYIDSLNLTKFPKNLKEGIHYPGKLSADWGNKIADLILAEIATYLKD